MLWVWLGTIYLIKMTWQDYVNNMNIDNRLNYFMFGLTAGLFALFQNKLIYLVGLIAITVIMSVILRIYKTMGEADINTLGWVFLGFAIINHVYAGWWLVFFLILMILYQAVKKIALKYKDPLPFYPVLLLSFVFNSILFKLY